MAKLVKNITIYSFVAVLEKATGFFLLPIYTSYLLPKEYGLLGIINSMTIILVVLFSLSTHDAVIRVFTRMDLSEEEKKEYLGNSNFLMIINTIVWSIVLFLINSKIEKISALKGLSFSPYIALAILACGFRGFIDRYNSLLLAEQRGLELGILNIINYFTKIGTILVGVIVFKLGALSFVLGMMAANIPLGIWTAIRLRRRSIFKISISKLKYILSYSIPLLPHSLAGFLMLTIDKFSLNGFLNNESVGIYNLASQFAMLIAVFMSAAARAYGPWFYSNYEKGKIAIIRKVSVLFNIAFCFIAFLVSSFSREVFTLMVDESFYSARIYIPLLVFAYATDALYFSYAGVFYMKNTKIVSTVTFLAAGINLLFNLLFIPKYGIMGATLATLISNVFRSGIGYSIATFKYKFRLNLVWIVASYAAFALLGYGVLIFIDQFLFLKILLTVSVLAILYFGVFKKILPDKIKQLI